MMQSNLSIPAKNRIFDFIDRGMPASRIAVDKGIPSADVSRWLEGENLPTIEAAALAWLDEMDRHTAKRFEGFAMTPTAKRIVSAFDDARMPRGRSERRGIALIYGASGAGKTQTAEWYADQQNIDGYGRGAVAGFYRNANVVIVRADGELSTWDKLLRAVIEKLDGHGLNTRASTLRSEIARRMNRGGLIVFDEAHLMSVKLMEQLRAICDEDGIALAFMGNFDVYKRIDDQKVAQIMARVGGARVSIHLPGEDDINAILETWNITGRENREFLTMIAHRDGGLHYLADTVERARQYESALLKPINTDLLKVCALKAGAWGGEA